MDIFGQKNKKDVPEVNALDGQLEGGIASIREGRRSVGRTLLLDLVKSRPNDLCAWLWLSSIAESDHDRRDCLLKILEIDPENQEARRGLIYLNAPPSDKASESLAPSQEPSSAPLQKKRKKRRRRHRSSQEKKRDRMAYLASVLCILGVLSFFYFKFIIPPGESASTPRVKTSSKKPMSSQIGIIPMSMALSRASDGWQAVRIKIAYENQSKFFRRFRMPTAQGTMVTEEDYRYPSIIKKVSKGALSGRPLSLWLPPGFRFWRTYSHSPGSVFESHYEIESRVAEQSHPSRVSISGHADIDLLKISERNLKFPIVNQDAVTRQIGHIIELPKEELRLKIEGIKREKLQFDPKGHVSDLFILSLAQENLNAGYEKRIPFSIIAISETGIVGSLSDEAMQKIADCPPLPTLGPNQKALARGCTVMPEGASGVKIILAIKTSASHKFVVVDSGY